MTNHKETREFVETVKGIISTEKQFFRPTYLELVHSFSALKTNIGTITDRVKVQIEIKQATWKHNFFQAKDLGGVRKKFSFWLTKAETSRWQTCVSDTLGTAKAMDAYIASNPRYQATDSLLLFLIQLSMVPKMRTIDGFLSLLESKLPDFVLLAVRSSLAYLSSALASKVGILLKCYLLISFVNTLVQEQTLNDPPLYLLLLCDCVYQLLMQFPTYFEFNESLLIYIMDEFYRGEYVHWSFWLISSPEH